MPATPSWPQSSNRPSAWEARWKWVCCAAAVVVGEPNVYNVCKVPLVWIRAVSIPIPKELWFRFLCSFQQFIWNRNGKESNLQFPISQTGRKNQFTIPDVEESTHIYSLNPAQPVQPSIPNKMNFLFKQGNQTFLQSLRCNSWHIDKVCQLFWTALVPPPPPQRLFRPLLFSV